MSSIDDDADIAAEAIGKFEASRDRLVLQVGKLSEQINSLNRKIALLETDTVDDATHSARTPLEKFPRVRLAQYKNWEPAIALQSYLGERGGGPIAMKKITTDLIKGGLNPTRRGMDVLLKICVGNKRDIFKYNEHDDTIRLAIAERKTSGR